MNRGISFLLIIKIENEETFPPPPFFNYWASGTISYYFVSGEEPRILCPFSPPSQSFWTGWNLTRHVHSKTHTKIGIEEENIKSETPIGIHLILEGVALLIQRKKEMGIKKPAKCVVVWPMGLILRCCAAGNDPRWVTGMCSSHLYLLVARFLLKTIPRLVSIVYSPFRNGGGKEGDCSRSSR